MTTTCYDCNDTGQQPATPDDHVLILQGFSELATTRPCTHAGITQAHLDECCADAVECDHCGTALDIDPRTLGVGDVRICFDCLVAFKDQTIGAGR